MSFNENYSRIEPCHIEETDGFGYAYIPGSQAGVVLLDMRSKRLLENLSISYQDSSDDKRIALMLENGLIEPTHSSSFVSSVSDNILKLNSSRIRSISTWLHVTSNCNLNCPYCYIAHKGSGHMSIDVAKDYLTKLEETVKVHDLQSVSIRFAGGEPTLNWSVVEYVANECQQRFSAQNVKVKLILITNGTTLSPKWINLLKRYSMGVCISVDGVGKWHDATRSYKNGKGSFNRVKSSIDLCMQNDFKPNILTTITDANIDGISQLSRFLIDNNLPFRYGVFRDYSGDYSGYRDFIQKVQVVIDDCYDYYADAIRKLRTKFQHQLCDLHLDRQRHLQCCNVGHSGVTVDHAGQVFVCQSQMDKQSIGHVHDSETLLQLLQSQQTLSGFTEQGVMGYSPCKSCIWAFVCGGGCPVTNISYSGTASSASPYCELFKSNIPALIKLKALNLIYHNIGHKEVNATDVQ